MKWLLIFYVLAGDIQAPGWSGCDRITNWFVYNEQNPIPATVDNRHGLYQVREFDNYRDLDFTIRHEQLINARVIQIDSVGKVIEYDVQQYMKLDSLTHEFDYYGATLIQKK